MPEREVAYKVRLDEELRDAFLRVAEANDRTGAQLVRDFMREYIAENKDALQSRIGIQGKEEE